MISMGGKGRWVRSAHFLAKHDVEGAEDEKDRAEGDKDEIVHGEGGGSARRVLVVAGRYHARPGRPN